MSVSKRIGLSDLEAATATRKALLQVEKQKEREATEEQNAIQEERIVAHLMGVFTADYIKEKIINAKIKHESSVYLCHLKYKPEEWRKRNMSSLYTRKLPNQTESLKQRIERLIETDDIRVECDEELYYGLYIQLTWGWEKKMPTMWHRQPCKFGCGVFLLIVVTVIGSLFLAFLYK